MRGYRETRLGPRDSLNNPYGGNLLVSSQFELLLPLPEKWRTRLRASLFYDIGNVFYTGGVTFVDDDGNPLDYDFSFDELRQSAGLALEWITPIGPLRLSYGVPLNDDDDNPNRFLRDELEEFQIAIGFGF